MQGLTLTHKVLMKIAHGAAPCLAELGVRAPVDDDGDMEADDKDARSKASADSSSFQWLGEWCVRVHPHPHVPISSSPDDRDGSIL